MLSLLVPEQLRDSLLFKWVVLVFFILVIAFCVFLLPFSSVHIWKSFFGFEEWVYFLVNTGFLNYGWRFLDSHEHYFSSTSAPLLKNLVCFWYMTLTSTYCGQQLKSGGDVMVYSWSIPIHGACGRSPKMHCLVLHLLWFFLIVRMAISWSLWEVFFLLTLSDVLHASSYQVGTLRFIFWVHKAPPASCIGW